VEVGAELTLAVPEALAVDAAQMLGDATSGRVVLALQQ
jgi:hypothetical protein